MERGLAGWWSQCPEKACNCHAQQPIATTQEPGRGRAAGDCWRLGGTQARDSSTHHLGSCLWVLSSKAATGKVAQSVHAVVGCECPLAEPAEAAGSIKMWPSGRLAWLFLLLEGSQWLSCDLALSLHRVQESPRTAWRETERQLREPCGSRHYSAVTKKGWWSVS